jgi:hypothetical protein
MMGRKGENMRLIRSLPVILALLLVSAKQISSQSQTEKSAFSVAISTAEQSFKAGSEVNIEITLTNISGKNISVYWPGDNLEPNDMEYQIVVINQVGKVPPRTRLGRNVIDHEPGIIMGHGPVLPNREVKVGETLKQKLNLNKFFLLEPGTYTVQLKRGDGENAAKSNTIRLTITSL